MKREREKEREWCCWLRVCMKDNRKWLRECNLFIYIVHRTSRAYLPFSFVVIRRNTNNGRTVWLRDGSWLSWLHLHFPLLWVLTINHANFSATFSKFDRICAWLSQITQLICLLDIYSVSIHRSVFCIGELKIIYKFQLSH